MERHTKVMDQKTWHGKDVNWPMGLMCFLSKSQQEFFVDIDKLILNLCGKI